MARSTLLSVHVDAFPVTNWDGMVLRWVDLCMVHRELV